MQALVAARGERVLLARRRGAGLFGGLWEPPSLPGGPRVGTQLCARFPLVGVARRGPVTHVLSHRRLTVDVLSGVLSADPAGAALPEHYEAADLFEEAGLERLGIAALTWKILRAAR